MDRRRILKFICGLPLLHPNLSLATRLLPRPHSEMEIINNLINVIEEKDSAREIGLYYLEKFIDSSDVRSLVKFILGNTVAITKNIVELNNPFELKRLIFRNIKNDFSQERVINVDGWILSITEVKLCALIALVKKENEGKTDQDYYSIYSCFNSARS